MLRDWAISDKFAMNTVTKCFHKAGPDGNPLRSRRMKVAKALPFETIPEWDGILLETQRCDGLFGWFVSVEEFMQIQNLMPCFPSSKDDFGDPESAYFEAFGEKPPTPRKAIIGYHLVPEDHADFPVVRFLCQDCDEIWKNQL